MPSASFHIRTALRYALPTCQSREKILKNMSPKKVHFLKWYLLKQNRDSSWNPRIETDDHVCKQASISEEEEVFTHSNSALIRFELFAVFAPQRQDSCEGEEGDIGMNVRSASRHSKIQWSKLCLSFLWASKWESALLCPNQGNISLFL